MTRNNVVLRAFRREPGEIRRVRFHGNLDAATL